MSEHSNQTCVDQAKCHMQYDHMGCFHAVSTVTDQPVRDSRFVSFSTHFARKFATNSDSVILLHSLNELKVYQQC